MVERQPGLCLCLTSPLPHSDPTALLEARPSLKWRKLRRPLCYSWPRWGSRTCSSQASEWRSYRCKPWDKWPSGGRGRIEASFPDIQSTSWSRASRRRRPWRGGQRRVVTKTKDFSFRKACCYLTTTSSRWRRSAGRRARTSSSSAARGRPRCSRWPTQSTEETKRSEIQMRWQTKRRMR